MFLVMGFILGFARAEVEINSATVNQLSSIQGVSQETAERIVKLRDTRGRINNLESLRALELTESEIDVLRQNVVVLLPIANVGSSSGKTFSSPSEVLGEFAYEPDIGEVQRMTMAYSRTNPQMVDKWLSAVKRAYALPKVNLQYEKELDGSVRYDYVAGEVSADAIRDYEQLENDDKIVVKLEWRLDKLVMSSEQIRVLNESKKSVTQRGKLLDEVTRLYFDRRRLQVEGLLNPAGSLGEQIEHELRLQEMTANLDALTGGAFSSAISK